MSIGSGRTFILNVSKGLAVPTLGMQGILTLSSCATGEKKEKKLQEKAADALLNKRETTVPGVMGRQDVKILEAIYPLMRTGKKYESAKVLHLHQINLPTFS